MANADKGIDCPVCGRRVKRYNRHMHHAQAVFLIKLYRHVNGVAGQMAESRDFATSKGEEKASTDAAYLDRFGLVEKDNKGGYALTETGVKFVEGQVSVPAYVTMLCGHVCDVATDSITIQDALDDPFDYDKLMDTPCACGCWCGENQ